MSIAVSTCFSLLLLLEICQKVSSLRLMFGDCPVYLDEPCTHLVKFTLFTTTPDEGTQFFPINPFKVKLPEDFNILTPIKVIIHGYGGLMLDTATRNVTRAYQDIGYNVFLVDWGALAAVPCYATAYMNTFHVGQCVVTLASRLLQLGINPSFLHVIGFSLGAHIAGFAGAFVKDHYGTPFYRITGLDPALPFFATMKNDWKLDKTDAKFVDIIHTSAGSFGKIEATGHADFYVNGGFGQPYCQNSHHPPLCSHLMAGIYFAESIRSSRDFVGRYCKNFATYMFSQCSWERTTVMGERCNLKTKGVYFVDTAALPPFALD